MLVDMGPFDPLPVKAARLRSCADALRALGAQLRGVGEVEWQGRAADRFRDELGDQLVAVYCAAALADDAALAVDRLAAVEAAHPAGWFGPP